MGGKRSGNRQHLYFAAASLILLVVMGCAPVKPPALECPACIQNGRLTRVEGLIASGNFEGAIKLSQELLASSTNGPQGDEALMELGLISAHYANPKKDYHKAIGYFLRLTKEFSNSSLAEEAKVWVGVLRAYEKAIQVDLDIEEMKKDIGR